MLYFFSCLFWFASYKYFQEFTNPFYFIDLLLSYYKIEIIFFSSKNTLTKNYSFRQSFLVYLIKIANYHYAEIPPYISFGFAIDRLPRHKSRSN